MASNNLKNLAPGKWRYVGDSIVARRTKLSENYPKGQLIYGIVWRENGKKRRKMIGAKRSSAQTVLAKVRTRIAEGKPAFPKVEETHTLYELCDAYEKYAEDHKKSHERDAGVIKKFKEFLANKPASDVSAFDIERYKAHAVKAVAESTIKREGESVAKQKRQAGVNRELAILKRMFNVGISWGWVVKNPVCDVKLYREGVRAYRALDDTEHDALLEACRNSKAGHLFPVVFTALNTGMRRGEILGLTWDRVDLAGRRLTVVNSKSGKPRDIPINDALADILGRLAGKRDGHVFQYAGRPIQRVTRAYNTAMKEAEIKNEKGHPRATFHSLRHTFATDCITNGVDVATLQQLLGHASIEMTMRYCHPTWESKQNAVNSLPNREKCSQYEVNEPDRSNHAVS